MRILRCIPISLVAAMILIAQIADSATAGQKKDKGGDKSGNWAKVMEENKALDQRFADAMSRKDVDALMMTYWHDPALRSVGPDGMVSTGPDAVRKSYVSWFMNADSISLKFMDQDYANHGDAVLGTGVAAITQMMGGKESTMHFRYTDIRRRMNGQWVYVYDQIMPVAMAGGGSGSLYARLGGYDAIAAVSDEFIKRLASDPLEARFFSGFSASSQMRLRQHLVDLLCHVSGGPCVYTGRDMKTVHTGLKITEADWEAGVRALQGTFDKFNVGEKERAEVLAAIGGLKGDIVGR